MLCAHKHNGVRYWFVLVGRLLSSQLKMRVSVFVPPHLNLFSLFSFPDRSQMTLTQVSVNTHLHNLSRLLLIRGFTSLLTKSISFKVVLPHSSLLYHFSSFLLLKPVGRPQHQSALDANDHVIEVCTCVWPSICPFIHAFSDMSSLHLHTHILMTDVIVSRI